MERLEEGCRVLVRDWHHGPKSKGTLLKILKSNPPYRVKLDSGETKRYPHALIGRYEMGVHVEFDPHSRKYEVKAPHVFSDDPPLFCDELAGSDSWGYDGGAIVVHDMDGFVKLAESKGITVEVVERRGCTPIMVDSEQIRLLFYLELPFKKLENYGSGTWLIYTATTADRDTVCRALDALERAVEAA